MAVRVPEFILRGMFVKGSLQRGADGFQFALLDSYAPATVTGFGLEVDGDPVPPGSISLCLAGGESVQADAISPERPFPLPVNTSVRVVVRGQGPGRGLSRLLAPRPFGAEISVDAERVLGQISPRVSGQFVEHLETCVFLLYRRMQTLAVEVSVSAPGFSVPALGLNISARSGVPFVDAGSAPRFPHLTRPEYIEFLTECGKPRKEKRMPDVGMDVVIAQMTAVLREAFEGPKERWSYFTDASPDAGLFGTLQKLSAADASRVLGRTPISAHVHHIVFALEASTRWIEGDRTTRNWKESWTVSGVDEAGWNKLRERLRAAYGDLQIAVARCAADSPEAIGGALGAVAHAAYHLGAIRQKVSITRGG